jgi:hypothetical protein
MCAVPHLPLCLGVLKHRASLAWGASSSCQNILYDGFLLNMWCNFKFEGVLFRSDSRHKDRVDSLTLLLQQIQKFIIKVFFQLETK